MHLPPPPDSRDLLPPLLACLPTAFVSPQPPPALLSLLSPLLRQRLTFLSSTTSPRNDGWLPLLSWDAERAAKLPGVVERMELEPHPVSGEIELDDVRPAKYRRLDEETLHSRLEVEQFELLPIYAWCETDEPGDSAGPGWKLAELRSLEDIDDGSEWFDSPSQATDALNNRKLAVPSQPNTSHNSLIPQTRSRQDQAEEHDEEEEEEEEDDDDYWASYDRTPGRTPAQKHSPVPPASTASASAAAAAANRQRSQPELEYYARYGAEVQPAMDGHDPDEENPEFAGQSTLNGSSLLHPHAAAVDETHNRPVSRPNGASMFPPTNQNLDVNTQSLHADVEAPRPISPTSSHGSIEKLEEKAAAMSQQQEEQDGGGGAQQHAIKQHISTDVKSLFRLAKSAGMERGEFERIVRTELECLGLLEEDE